MLDINSNELKKKGFVDQMYRNFLTSVRYGKNHLQQVYFKEDLTFKDEWILTIEDLLFSVERITKNPMRSIKDELELTIIEKAKHISSRTLRHLAINSKDVASYEDGKIKPLRVLTKHMEEDMLIYENRLVYTLINRLIVFMEARYRKIKKAIDSRDITRLKVASTFKVGKNDVECNISFNVSEPQLSVAEGDNNAALLEKIEMIRKRLRIMQSTSFYAQLSKTRPLNPPIIKTNALLMNRDYNNAYKLWLFISAYRESGFTVKVTEKQFTFDKDYYDDLTSLVALGLRTMIANNAIREKRFAGIRTRATRVKRYRLGDDIVYQGLHKRQKAISAPEEVINEYYYQAIKEQLIKSDLLKDAPKEAAPIDTEEQLLQYERDLETTFADFFTAIMKINNTLFWERQGINHPRDDYNMLEKIGDIKAAIKAQRTRYNRFRTIATLKLHDVRAALKREGEELAALQLLFARLAMLQTKTYEKVVAEDGEICREVLMRAEKIIQDAEEQREKYLERALQRLKAGETRKRLAQLKEILSNTEKEIREKLQEEFYQKILEAERKSHELAKSLQEKEERKRSLEQKEQLLKAEIRKISEDNERYLAENKRLMQEKMQNALEELARQSEEYEQIVAREKQKLTEQRATGDAQLAAQQEQNAAYLANLKEENEKLFSAGLKEAEENKKVMLATLAAKAKENEDYINTQKVAIAQKLRKDLAEIDLIKTQNKVRLKALVLKIESEKSQRFAELETQRAQGDLAYREALAELEALKTEKMQELNAKKAKELAYLEEKKALDEKYLQAERQWIEKQKAQKKAELEAIEAQYAAEIKEQEREIAAAYDEEQLRLELLEEENKRLLLEQEQEAKELFKQEKEALELKRRAYRQELREAVSILEEEKQKADMFAKKLLEGKLTLYPSDNINRIYKYIVTERPPLKDIRQNRVRRASAKANASTIRKWQLN